MTNTVVVLQAMTQLLRKRDLSVIERFWDKRAYFEHNSRIADGHDGCARSLGAWAPALPMSRQWSPGMVAGVEEQRHGPQSLHGFKTKPHASKIQVTRSLAWAVSQLSPSTKDRS